MRRVILRHPRWRVMLAIPVALAQLSTATWITVVHAQTIESAAAAAVEDAHSTDCSEIHVETWCRSCAASLDFIPTAYRLLKRDTHGIREALTSTTQRSPRLHLLLSANAVRAPPSR